MIADALQADTEQLVTDPVGTRFELSEPRRGRRWMMAKVHKDQFNEPCIPAFFSGSSRPKTDLVDHLKKVKTHCVGNAIISMRFKRSDKKRIFVDKPWEFAATLCMFEIMGTTEECSYSDIIESLRSHQSKQDKSSLSYIKREEKEQEEQIKEEIEGKQVKGEDKEQGSQVVKEEAKEQGKQEVKEEEEDRVQKEKQEDQSAKEDLGEDALSSAAARLKLA